MQVEPPTLVPLIELFANFSALNWMQLLLSKFRSKDTFAVMAERAQTSGLVGGARKVDFFAQSQRRLTS